MADVSHLRAALLTAYERLRKDELILFCGLRRLQTTGTHAQLAKRLADHDLSTYPPIPILQSSPVITQHALEASTSKNDPHAHHDRQIHQEQALRPSLGHQFPLELVVEILDHVGDWELSKAVGLPTSLPTPREWSKATKLDLAILSRNLTRVRQTPGPFYGVSARAAIRFSCVDIIDYLYHNHRERFNKVFEPKGQLLSAKGSLQGSIKVLDWWKEHYAQQNAYDHVAIDNACVNGHIHVLQWWVDSSLPLRYSEAALEHASSKGHIDILDWWKESGLPLKIGRVMDLASGNGLVDVLEWWRASGLKFQHDRVPLYHASCSGKVNALDWWARSGLQMIYDSDCLIGATRHNKPEALEWWDCSGLPIQYRLCDIEEALEDAIGGGALARGWWEKKGVDFKANFTEWTKFHSLH